VLRVSEDLMMFDLRGNRGVYVHDAGGGDVGRYGVSGVRPRCCGGRGCIAGGQGADSNLGSFHLCGVADSTLGKATGAEGLTRRVEKDRTFWRSASGVFSTRGRGLFSASLPSLGEVMEQ